MWLAAFAGLGLAQLGTSAALYSETDRLRQLQVSSGLLPEAVRLQSKYDPTAGTLPPFPNDTAGTFFSGVFSDHTVLQREPAKAVVFGVLFGAQSSTTVTVTVVDVVPANGATMYSVQADVMLSDIQMPSGRYAKWKAYLKPTPAGGNFTISVSCASCTNTTVTTINDVTFGDVWFCSGQSNMWLPMNMDTSRNVTYDAVLAGKYTNIRMHTMMHNNQPDGGISGYDLDIAPPPPPWRSYGGDPAGGWLLPTVGSYANKTCRDALGPQGQCENPDDCHMCTAYKLPNQDWLYNSINQFSAACWHFAEHLTDIAEAKNETIVPYGLVASHWGGTMVEHWQPNSTLNAGTCKNNSGGAYAPWQNGRWDIDSGGLYNGMVRPFLNMTIKGALWYQGENNVFQCHGANSTLQHGSDSGGPLACGSIADSTGYACMMKNLIDTWREGWSAEPGTSDSSFPFGLVSLAGGTSEGSPFNMGAFRYAQTGNTGFLPNEHLPNTFAAQAFDTGDPCEGGSQCCLNRVDGQGGWACESGEAPYTGQFMGGIHPRVKKIVGTRLAKAARALVYEDKKQVWTGPVLESCTVTANEIVLKFDQQKMLHDTIQVLQPTVKAIDLTRHPMAHNDWSADQLTLLQSLLNGGGSTPMEVQLNGATTGEMSDGVWLPVSLQEKCSNTPNRDNVNPGQGGCSWNYTASTKLAGWDEVHIPLPGFGSLINNLTAVRYGWGGNPCCPGVNRFMIPCPPNSCPIQTFNSSLPAPPFWATIADGKCDWISTKGPPTK